MLFVTSAKLRNHPKTIGTYLSACPHGEKNMSHPFFLLSLPLHRILIKTG
nr:MAG TPA: hypothetical protein [Caudoviricetes sp.]